jgi:hypothetical protein
VGAGLARDWALDVARGPGAELRTRHEYIPVGSAPALPGGRRSETLPPDLVLPQSATPGQGPLPHTHAPTLPDSAHFDSKTCGDGPAVALRKGSGGALWVRTTPPTLRHVRITRAPLSWHRAPLRRAPAGGEGQADRRPPGRFLLLQNRDGGRMAGAEPTGTYSWRVRLPLTASRGRPKRSTLSQKRHTHDPHVSLPSTRMAPCQSFGVS